MIVLECDSLRAGPMTAGENRFHHDDLSPLSSRSRLPGFIYSLKNCPFALSSNHSIEKNRKTQVFKVAVLV